MANLKIKGILKHVKWKGLKCKDHWGGDKSLVWHHIDDRVQWNLSWRPLPQDHLSWRTRYAYSSRRSLHFRTRQVVLYMSGIVHVVSVHHWSSEIRIHFEITIIHVSFNRMLHRIFSKDVHSKIFWNTANTFSKYIYMYTPCTQITAIIAPTNIAQVEKI